MLDAAALHRLVEVLIERGYRVVGPTLRDNAIVLAELDSRRRPAARLGRRCRAGALPGAPPRRRRRIRALVRDRSRGSSSCTRRGSGCGRATGTGRRLRIRRGAAALRLPRGARLRPGGDRASWTGCLSGGAAPGRLATSAGVGRSSWSRSTAPNLAGCASARRWAPAPPAGPATTWL